MLLGVMYVFLHDIYDVYCVTLKPYKQNFHRDSRWCSVVLLHFKPILLSTPEEYLSFHLPGTQNHRQYVTYNPQGNRINNESIHTAYISGSSGERNREAL